MISERIIGRKAEHAYRRLLSDLEAGRFPEHSALPAALVLCAEYGVSHPTLRKAVAVLEEESRLIVRQGDGTYVAAPPAPKNGATRSVAVMAIAEDAMLKTLQSRLLQEGYLMNVCLQGSTHWDPEEERRYLERVKEHPCAALLAFCSPLPPTHEVQLKALRYAGVRVVHYEHYRVDPPEEEYLLPDYERAGHMAAMKLMLAGYAPLVLMGHWDGAPSPSERLVERGFARALDEHGGGYDAERQRRLILAACADYQGRLRSFLADLPVNTGLVVPNGGHAGALRDALAAAGRGADEVGIVAIENAADSRNDRVAHLHFRRDEQVRRLAEIATGALATEVRELMAPVWQPGETVRGQG